MSSNIQEAERLFAEGYTCPQAVIGAYCEELGMDFETAMKLSSPFGSGMARLREVCGAVSGMFMVAGLKYGFVDPKDKEARKKHYEMIQKMAQRFKEKNGSIICGYLLGLDIGKPRRPCIELVKCAAEIIDEILIESCDDNAKTAV